MLASLVDAPLDDSRLVYEPKYDGIRAIAEIAPKGKTVRLWSRLGNEKTRQFPEVAAALGEWARRRTQPLRARWRDRRARSGGRSDWFSEPAGPHPSWRPRCRRGGQLAFARSTQAAGDCRCASRRLHRLRPPARRRDRLPRSAAHHPARGARKTLQPHRHIYASPQPAGRRRRARAQEGSDGARLGRADREARRLALQVGQAHARLAQAQDCSRAGIRHRRLDRTAAVARLFRRAVARRLRRRRSRLRRAHRHRLQRAGALQGDEAAGAARNRRLSVQEPAEDERAPALGCGRSWWRRSSSRSGRRTRSCDIRFTSACGTTRSRARSGARKTRRCGARPSTSARRPTRRRKVEVLERRSPRERRRRRRISRTCSTSSRRSKKRARTASSSSPAATASRSPTCTRFSGRSRS